MTILQLYNGIIGNLQYYSKINFTTEEIFEYRIKICKECENVENPNNISKIKCTMCGCSLKKKLILKNSMCKKQKW